MNLSEFSKKRILVVGDICLDRNRIGDIVEGSCREADIPTIRVKKGKKYHKDEYAPGAGGNVAANFSCLGAQVSIGGIIGEDIHGEILKQELKSRNINLDFLYSSSSRATITFERSYDVKYPSKPVGRWDTENEYSVPKTALGKLKREVIKNSARYDAIVITDYCEVDESTAVITESFLEELAELKGKTKVFGASRNRIGIFENLYCIIPNENELMRANGYKLESFEEELSADRVITEGKHFYKRIRPEYLVVTLGSRGAFLHDQYTLERIPTKPLERSEIDITGCGDTFLATLTLADLSGYSRKEAVHLANVAAGTTARKLGTTGTTTQKELLEALK